MHDVKSVKFNDGNNEDVFALVVGDPGGHKLHLYVIPGNGPAYRENDVPHREKDDYPAGGGGGRTWHH